MTVLARSRLVLAPNALALREIGPWLRATTSELTDAAVTAAVARSELAVHEACMNVVDHANLPPGSTLEVRLVLSTDRLTLTVVDGGDEFHLADVKSPPSHVMQERGFGVKIIRSLVDELTYRRVGSTNELELTIYPGEHR